MNEKKARRDSDYYAIALAVVMCLSLLTLPLAVQASDPAPQAYQNMGNGVFESTFTRNVSGIQEATHEIVITSTGAHVTGWI